MSSLIKITDLGSFGKVFEGLIEKYGLEDKKSDILNVLGDLILGKIDEPTALNIFWDGLKIETGVATDLIYDIKESILDKKKELEAVKQNLQKDFSNAFSPQIIADEFLSGINLKIADPIIKKRYYDAILSWLKDARKNADLKEVLNRSTKIGGVGMDQDTYDKLEELLIQKKQQIAQENIDMPQIISSFEAGAGAANDFVEESEIDVAAKVKGPITQTRESQDVHIGQLLQEKGIDFGELADKEKIKRELGDTERVPEVTGDFADEIIKEEEFLQSKPEIVSKPVQPAAELLQKEKIEQNMPQPQMKPPTIRRADNQRPKVEDVRMETSTKLYGPIDELAALSIMDFRRLSKDPSEAALKITGKLDLLEDESLIKKMQGMKALRSSPLYKTYAEIMNQAMKEGKSIEQVVNEKNIITLPEFKAIMALNQDLKY